MAQGLFLGPPHASDLEPLSLGRLNRRICKGASSPIHPAVMHSFNKHLPWVCSVPGTLLGTGNKYIPTFHPHFTKWETEAWQWGFPHASGRWKEKPVPPPSTGRVRLSPGVPGPQMPEFCSPGPTWALTSSPQPVAGVAIRPPCTDLSLDSWGPAPPSRAAPWWWKNSLKEQL